MLDAKKCQKILEEEVEKLRQGKTSPSNVRAINGSINTLLRIIKLEVEVAKLTGEKPNVKKFLTTI